MGRRRLTSGPPRQKIREFRKLLRLWWEKDCSVALDLAFGSKREPTVKESSFMKWFKKTGVIERAYEPLLEIYCRYGLPPWEILEILASHKVEDLLWPPKLKSKIRSLKQREKDANVLEKAAKVLEGWESVQESAHLRVSVFQTVEGDVTQPYSLSEKVMEQAGEIRGLGPTAAHRPREINRIECAKTLAAKLRERTGKPLYRLIGELTWATFGDKQKPPYTFQEFGKKLVKAKLREEEIERKTPLVYR